LTNDFPDSTMVACGVKLFLKSSGSFRKSTSPVTSSTCAPRPLPGTFLHDASILAHLDRENAMSPRALAAHLSVAASTLSAAIARLSRLGYLTSEPSSSDKRQRELRLTARGAKAIALTSVLDEKRVRKLLGRLNAQERATALRGLQLLARAARQMKQPK
jgi:DNA-binding MarR family transcriptional regulator